MGKWTTVACCAILYFLLQAHHAQAGMLTIIGEHLNVRSGPGRTYDIIAVVKKNEKFEALETQEGWHQISVEGNVGWISGKGVALSHDKGVQELLRQADDYFFRQQFTTPPEANAYDIYREVLQREADNAHARKRIRQMARTYKTWADKANKNGEHEKATIFYQRYLFISPQNQEVRTLLEKAEHSAAASPSPLKILRLRSDPATLSRSKIVAMVKKYGFNHPADWSKYGLSASISGNFQHEYTLQESQGTAVVIDYATGLMWQQSGSSDPMSWSGAHEYVSELNQRQYAGFSDWRLPTVNELTSLMEAEKTSARLYRAPMFATTQLWCWSADLSDSANTAWYVSFSSGGIQQHGTENPVFALAVRSYE